MCCGQKRAELRSSSIPPTARTTPPARISYQPAPPAPKLPSRDLTAPTGIAVESKPVRPPAQIIRRPSPIATPYPPVSVRYLESSPIRVRGPVTGQQYEFSGSGPVQSVDARDAASLLQSRFFRRG